MSARIDGGQGVTHAPRPGWPSNDRGVRCRHDGRRAGAGRANDGANETPGDDSVRGRNLGRRGTPTLSLSRKNATRRNRRDVA